MSVKMTPEQQAAQLRKPEGALSADIIEYMNKGNATLYENVFNGLNLKSGMRILEIGPGNAPLASRLVTAHSNIHYTGLDYSADSIRFAKQYNQQQLESGYIQFVLGDVQSMPFESECFDVILGINIVYFLDNLEPEMSQLYRVLKPGGRIILGYRPKEVISKLPFALNGFRHFDIKELCETLENTGFKNPQTTAIDEPDRLVNGQSFKMKHAVTTAEK